MTKKGTTENCANMDNISVFSVFEITQHLKQVIESSIEPLYVKGEITNYVHHSSGHIYFNLKDERATLRCTFFKNVNYRLDFKPQNGQSVICFGRLTVFVSGGSYNLNVSSMMPGGLGEMQARFEELKKKLNAEGLFDPARKKKLPAYPQTLGIITSPTSAALQDVMNILRRRYPIEAFVYPALTQGLEAPATMIKALAYFNTVKPVDLIILTRGGGSQEDLFCFNDEALARAIFTSTIPVISAVGHEIDFTISDFVADLRAPTPSAAAELAVPDKAELLQYIESLGKRLELQFQNRLNRLKEPLNTLNQQLMRYHPEKLWMQYQQRFDLASMALFNKAQRIKEYQNSLDRIASPFAQALDSRLKPLAKEHRYHLQELEKSLLQSAQATLESKTKNLALWEGILQEQSPKRLMQKGWALITKDAAVLSSVQNLAIGEKVELQLQDGKALAEIADIQKDNS